MKTLCLLFLFAALTVSAQTNRTPYCCRFPLRVLGPGQNVNLTPLCQWWLEHGGRNENPSDSLTNYPDTLRPLTAWKRIRGFKTAELDYGWVVNAEASTSPTDRTNEFIILRHPPAAEEQQYYYLQSQIDQFSQQLTNDAVADKEALTAEHRADNRAKRDNESYSKMVRNYSVDYSAVAAQDRQNAANALNQEKKDAVALAQARAQFAALPGKLGRYQIDCFALELGRNNRVQPVFDAGEMYPATP